MKIGKITITLSVKGYDDKKTKIIVSVKTIGKITVVELITTLIVFFICKQKNLQPQPPHPRQPSLPPPSAALGGGGL